MDMTKLPSLPSLPKATRARKAKPTRPCVCGCGQSTKATWFPGHDGRATGWALRVERGLVKVEGIPAGERAGALLMLRRRGYGQLGTQAA